MAKAVKALRKLLVSLIGFPLFLFGLVLIPLPGPGLLVCLLAVLILSTEFDWASRHADKYRNELKKFIDKHKASKPKPNDR